MLSFDAQKTRASSPRSDREVLQVSSGMCNEQSTSMQLEEQTRCSQCKRGQLTCHRADKVLVRPTVL